MASNAPKQRYSGHTLEAWDGKSVDPYAVTRNKWAFMLTASVAIPAVTVPLAGYAPVAFAGVSTRALTTAGVVNGGIGLAVQGTFQLTTNKPGESFDKIDFLMGGLINAATTGTGLLPSVYINTLGAYSSSTIKVQNPLPNMAAAGVGSSAGSIAGDTINYLPTKKYFNSSTRDFAGSVLSSVIQNETENKLKGKDN